MDYQSILIRFISILFLVNFISGCDTEVSPEPLRITGTPPDLLYYDSNFEFTFGATGGDGVYRYRYIQHPDISDNEELKENPVEMNIEVIDGPKPSFILRGVPKLPLGVNFDNLNNLKYRYQIELTDGINTVVQSYDFTLNKNKIRILNTSSIKEGLVSNQPAINLQDQLAIPDQRTKICSDVSENTYEKKLLSTGEYAYPKVFQVIADSQVASRTKLYYRFETNYNDIEPERSKRNLNFARKGVDYIDDIRSVVLEPGQITCAIYIDILDDLIVEDKEVVSIEFFDHEGGAIDYSGARASLEIVDNEDHPKYISKQIVRNRGDKVIVPIGLTRPVDYPVTVNVSIDSEKTTASQSEFTLEPAGGVITLAPGQVDASYSVTLLDNMSQNTTSLDDKIITIYTDIDDILDVEPFTIEINEWSNSTEVESEVIGRSTNDEEIVDFIVDGDGFITTLLKSESGLNTAAIVKSYKKNSDPVNFTSSGNFDISKVGLNVIPKAIVNSTDTSIYNLFIVLNVDGIFADVYRGGTDFVVMSFQKEIGSTYQLVSSKQFGTEGNDIVSGAMLENNILYVYGKTNGENFEGAPTFESNNGGEDGFLYSIDFSNNTYNWARFLGTPDQDNLVSIDAGNREIVSVVSRKSTDEDAFIRRLSLDGQDIENEIPITISTLRDDRPVSVRFDASASNYNVLFDSDAQLAVSDQSTPSLSRDVQLVSYNSKNEVGGVLELATDQEDIAKSLENTPNKQKLLVAGDTYGEMKGNVKKGNADTDAFISILSTEDLNNLELLSSIQFGTPSKDQLISVKPVSNTKFFALWREEHTDPNNFTYRISAFSIDGKKLSRDPE